MKYNSISKALKTLSIAGVIAISSTACNTQPKQTAVPESPAPSTTQKTSEQTQAQPATIDIVWDAYTPYKDTITFTKGINVSGNMNFPSGDNFENNDLYNYVKEKLNVVSKVAWETADSKAYDQKVALSIASKDIPDMMRVTKPVFKQMVENDLLLDMTEAFDKCASPFIREQYESYGDRLLDQTRVDGKLMGIPGTQIGGATTLLWVRQDWLDKLNLPVPKTLEDIKNVAKEFIEKDPGGNGPGKTIGILMREDKFLGNYNTQHVFDTVFGLYDAYPRLWITKDGKAVYGSVAPEAKVGLEVLRDWYKEGIIDKEFAIRKDVDRQAIVSSGQVGLVFAAWWGGGGIKESVVNNPDADWTPVAAPLDQNGNLNGFEHDPVNGIAVFSKSFKNPEALVKVINVENDILRGKADAKPAYDAMIKRSPGLSWAVMPLPIQIDYQDVTKRILDDVIAAQKVGDVNAMKISGFTLAYEAKTQMEKDYQGTKKASIDLWNNYKGRIIATGVATQNNVKLKPLAFYGITETMSTKWSTLEKLELETYIGIIMGTKDISEFDKFVQDWYKLGGEEITAEVEEARIK